MFHLEEDASTLVRPGASVLVSATAAGTSRGRVFTMPGEFAVAAPAEFETVSAAFVEARVDGDDGQAFVTTVLVRRRAFYFGP